MVCKSILITKTKSKITKLDVSDNIKKEFEDNGYELPKICFWNVNGDCGNTIPLQENKYGLILCSGFSINIVNMLLSGKTDPYEVLMDVLYSKRYDAVGNIFKK